MKCRRALVISLLSLALGLVATACGIAEGEEALLSADCSIEQDQRGSFMPAVSKFPIRIVIDRDFTSDEQGQIQRAMITWNSYGQELFHQAFFDFAVGTVPPDAKKFDPDECGRSGRE